MYHGQGACVRHDGMTSWGCLSEVPYNERMDQSLIYYFGEECMDYRSGKIDNQKSHQVDAEKSFDIFKTRIEATPPDFNPPIAMKINPVSQILSKYMPTLLPHIKRAPKTSINVQDGTVGADITYYEENNQQWILMKMRRHNLVHGAAEDAWTWNGKHMDINTGPLPSSVKNILPGEKLSKVTGEKIHDELVIERAMQRSTNRLRLQLTIAK